VIALAKRLTPAKIRDARPVLLTSPASDREASGYVRTHFRSITEHFIWLLYTNDFALLEHFCWIELLNVAAHFSALRMT
jgi:hypothetical protein